MNPNNEHKRNVLVELFESSQSSGLLTFYNEEDLLELIIHYEENSQYEKALEVAMLGINQYSYSAIFFLYSAKLEFYSDNLDEALQYLVFAEKLDPHNLEVHYLKAQMINSAGNPQEAIEVLNRLIHSLSDHDVISSVYLQMSGLWEYNENYDEMYRSLKKAIIYDHFNEAALEKIWLCVEMTESYKESESFHKRFLEREPFSVFAWHNLGHAQSCLKKYEEAVSSFEYAYILEPNFEFAYRDCAEMHLQTGDFAKALEVYEDAMSRFKVDEDYLFKIGFCYENMGMKADARRMYKKALKLNANNDMVYYRIGKTYLDEQNFNPAKYFLCKAYEKNDRNELYAYDLGNLYYSMSNMDSATEYFERAVEIAPEYSIYWVRLASIYIESGLLEDALEVLEDASDHTFDSNINYCKAACLLRMGNRQSAFSILSTMLANHYDTHNVMFDFCPILEQDHALVQMIDNYRQ